MEPTRRRDLIAAVVVAGFVSYLVVDAMYRYFPRLTVWTGLSLLLVGAAEFGWAFYVRRKISEGEIGDGKGRLHPLTVARSLTASKASAWVGAVMFGWWLGVLVFLLPKQQAEFPARDTPGAVVAAVSALALLLAALWLQHCCKSPPEPPDDADGVLE
jgi:hypothetical protein